jgi:Ca2+-binding RTX toxin-like protein
VAEKEKEVELKEEQLEEAKIELEEKLEQAAPQEKAKIEEELAKVEEEIVEVEEIREEIIEEKIQFEEKIQEVEEVVQKIEQRFQEVEQKFEAVFVQEQNIEQNFQQIEQEIQQIEQEFQQFFQELEQDFGAEVINEVEKAFNEADVVFEDKIEEQVIQEIKEEPKVDEDVNADIFEDDADMPEEDMEQIQKIEEELRLEEEAFKEQIEADFDQAKEDGEIPEGAPKEVQDIFNEADNFQEFEQEMEKLMQDDAFQQEMQAQDDMFQQEEVFVEEQFKMDDFKMDDFKQEEEQLVAFEEPVYQEEQYNIEQDYFNYDYDMQFDYVQIEDLQIVAYDDAYLWVNTAPTISTIGNVSKSESLSVGSTIATASASDADGDYLTYSLTVDQSGNLEIDSDTGEITLASSFTDVTEDTNYNVTVRAFDGTDDAKADFVLTVTADGTLSLTEIHTTGDGTSGDYAQTIGYVGTNASQVSTVITDLGHTAVDFVPGTTNIDTVDVLWYLNPDNWGWSENVGSYQTDIFNWVDSGGVFVIHDRYVEGANDFLLGETATITRETYNDYSNYDIIDESSTNLLREGPGGTLTDSSGGDIGGSPNSNGEFNLDGGNSTSHGSADYTTFDLSKELALATKTDTDSVIDFIYKYGDGAVYYSTVPLDYYIPSYASAQAYAKNAVHYATSLIFDGYSTIKGTSSADNIYGTGGDDVIWGSAGADTLWGGAGADVFDYNATTDSNTSTVDTISDFNASEDSIDVSDITNSVTKVISGTQLQLDTDGDSTADMYINLTGFTGTVDDVTVVT